MKLGKGRFQTLRMGISHKCIKTKQGVKGQTAKLDNRGPRT